ncbi:interleukin-1 receptor type 1-like isoform X1 [Crotalus tigris]|uniref:interleukin-1 receptor type 1-like isoform X1 n=1 Tax=Crotalus tigris TaxID=88082 RepID=UPI00192F3F16|nr:interleukin-1 receptor type 1-like isoform X1 [Crotalus tigris]XP_039211683.1 interleukin-1 receptor type 1-like isoform X1 [Crotalus tigris]XP_039211684.1 interleukin-1 receptor type 1-like isoform X1 [Crotalus tigris]XP_039211685.1 interleukin-1 receptor type 1-like isoform X1 [Crotalus tigris]
MFSALWLTSWIYLIHFVFSCCENLISSFPKGEPGTVSCLQGSQSNHVVTWYRNDIEAPISTDNCSRVYQQANLLWFYPAKLEDSGIYQCTYNSTRINKTLIVFENSVGLCFNKGMVFEQKVPLKYNGKLTCPDLHNFRNYDNAPLTLQWFKECHFHLYEDWKFRSSGDYLLIKNVTKEDEGIYICRAKHIYMGKEYNISRAINLTTFEIAKKNIPDIIYPNNNSIEVKPGSRFDLVCNVSADPLDYMVIVTWKFNNEILNTDENDKVLSGKRIIEAKLNISKVKYRDYGKYLCEVWSKHVTQVAYVMLNYPGSFMYKSIAPNTQYYVIGGLISALFIIVASLLTYKFFKVDIVLWYRDSCQHLRKGISDEKVYDAYVLYPHNISGYVYLTENFVFKLLPEILEKQCGYKLFILGRDDVPGQAVITIVDKMVKLSRRVIIILMPDLYCGGMQSLFSEQELAVYSALIQEETKVILIQLDKIKDFNSMPESLRYLKQKHGILTWRGTFTETTEMATTRFWKNVRYQMPASPSTLSSDLHFLPIHFHSSQISDG